ncbi:uncharacterized protein A4U43_C03F8400 [Asparagus officinalis]|uniref:F-box/LRR-repeat protein 15/At3g58940/PEG3-like LRR domain-containing protein n=1 Tax=Asparagus officinalis TaxID=4686 RepID=A0A5P1FA73_ASPOF|nr:uncharacterized protein A4U43_C03F8400 [Asparagus officinalis]
MAMTSKVQEMHLDFTGGGHFLPYGRYANDPFWAYHCNIDTRCRNYYASHDNGYSSSELDLASEDSSSSDSDEGPHSSFFVMLRALFSYASLRVLKLAGCCITNPGPMNFGNLTCLVFIDVKISQKNLHKVLPICCCKLEVLGLTRFRQLKHLAFLIQNYLA